MLTLTQRNCLADILPSRIDDMLAAWRAICHSLRGMRRYLHGYARTIEITVGRDGLYHPHIHAIMIMDRDTPKAMLRAGYWANLWADYMGTDAYQSCKPICDIRPIRPNKRRNCTSAASAAAEVSKYTAKVGSILSRSDAYERILAIDAAIRGRKLRSYGGVWRKIRSELRLSDTEPLEEATTLLSNAPLEIWHWSGAEYRRVDDTRREAASMFDS